MLSCRNFFPLVIDEYVPHMHEHVLLFRGFHIISFADCGL